MLTHGSRQAAPWLIFDVRQNWRVIYLLISLFIVVFGTFRATRGAMDSLVARLALAVMSPLLLVPVAKVLSTVVVLLVLAFLRFFEIELKDDSDVMPHLVGFGMVGVALACLALIRKIMRA